MQMISFVFIGFTAIIFAALYVCNKVLKTDFQKSVAGKWILLIGSFLFVLYADWKFAAVLGALSVIVWFCARKKEYIPFGIVAALGSLAFFKYTNFFLDSFSRLFGKTDYVALKLILPLGISFYTFSAISYLIDVKRNKVQPAALLDVSLYLSFFPKITSGPIQRSQDFFEQMEKPRQVNWENFSAGIQIFCFGLFKKIVLADRLSVFVNQVYETPLAFGSFTVFLAMCAYSLQIYFDFSGYSDMAIGVGRVLDIRLPRNFNLPYLSHNVTELWKRWHITLSSWLQEYLYISLGGNRKGTIRTYINLILTMVLGGIWHGASWNYIIWGALHGVALAVHKLWSNVTGSGKKKHSVPANLISIAITFLFTSVCWVFFRAESLEQALLILVQMVSFKPGLQQPYLWLFFGAIVLCVGSAMAFHFTKDRTLPEKRQNQSFVDGYYPIGDLKTFWGLVWFFVLCGLIVGLAHTGGSPFIYGAY